MDHISAQFMHEFPLVLQNQDARIIMTAMYEDRAKVLLCDVSTNTTLVKVIRIQ